MHINTVIAVTSVNVIERLPKQVKILEIYLNGSFFLTSKQLILRFAVKFRAVKMFKESVSFTLRIKLCAH